MIIPITIPLHSDDTTKLPPPLAKLGHDELCLIELQGVLDVECSDPNEKNGQMIGTLILEDGRKPTLRIGHHLLEGEIKNLMKPLGVLHRTSPDSITAQAGKDLREEGTGVEWNVVAVVKKKIVFAKRPMPIAFTR